MKILEKFVGGIACIGVFGLVAVLGCDGLTSTWDGLGYPCQKPKARKGYYATATAGTTFLGLNELGIHGVSEGNGQVYCCEAGHIDIPHLRKSADWTAFLAQKTYENLMNNKDEFIFKLFEPSVYHVRLDYPDNWNSLSKSEKQKIAKDVSIALGEYFGYNALVWHEMLTWYGYKITGVWSEFPSAFSWEDQFSNILGSYLAAEVLRKGGNFSQGMTKALNQELEKLGVQSKKISKKASQKVRGEWWSGGAYFFVDISKRNFDIGLDGYVTPLLVPELLECQGARPVSYTAPDRDVSKYGFSMSLEIEPRDSAGNEILRIINKKRIEPKTDFVVIMENIKKDAVRKFGSSVDKPGL